MTTAGLECWNGGVPVSSWNAVAASAYWSARPSTSSPLSCSGAEYATVPTVMFVPVSALGSPIQRAIPKSANMIRSAVGIGVGHQDVRRFHIAVQ